MKPRYVFLVVLLALVCLLPVSALAFNIGPPPPASINVWLTTPDGKSQLAQQPEIGWWQSIIVPSAAISVDSTTTYQSIVGFGAALTQTASSLLARSPNEPALLASLFGPSGINISLLRDPLGCPDFCDTTFYSYSAGPGQFSLGHDALYTIPTLEAAQALNPALAHIAAPWSPPAWMKSNGSLEAGSLLAADNAAYATYLVQTLQAYQAEGIPIAYLSPQNEPGFVPSTYPSSGWSASQEDTFIGQNLLPDLAAAGLSPTVLIYDDSYRPGNTASTFAADAATLPVDTAAHCYNGLPTSSSQIKGLLLETECATSITSYASTAADPLKPEDALIDWMNAGASSFLYWNIAADQNLGPQPEGSAVCHCVPLMTIDTDSNGNPTGSVTYNAEYWALGQASKFIRPGAVRIASSTTNSAVKEVAFKNTDGSTVLLLRNTSTARVIYSFGTATQRTVYSIPAGAIETLEWSH